MNLPSLLNLTGHHTRHVLFMRNKKPAMASPALGIDPLF